MNQGRKKALFLITKATWGGAQKYVYDLATHLSKELFQVSVAYGTAGRLLTMLKEKNVPTYALPSLGRDVALFSDIASFFQLVQLLRAERPDVLHVNSSKAAALGALAGRLCGMPRIIFTVHGWPFKEDRNFLLRGMIYFVSWFTALLSHATIVVSKRDEEIGKKMWFVGKKIHYIPLGIEPPVFLPRDEAARALSIATLSPRIVTIAELTLNKGIRYAIEAIVELKKRGINVEYFIVGDGELRSSLEQQVKTAGVADRVHFLGFVESAENYLKAFDLFLLPSIKEGTPYVLLEAEAADLLIVATSVIDGSFLTTLIVPADSHMLADAIHLTLKGRRTRAKFHSSLADMVKQTTVLYS